MSETPTNIWVECSPDEGWEPGVRGERLLERPPGTRLVSAVWELDAGARSPKYHCHHGAEELLVLLSGEAVLRTPTGERPLREGDVAHFPVGAAGAHEVINRSEQTIRYLMVAAHNPLDVIEYVDDSRIVVYSHADSLLQPDGLFFSHEVADDA